MIPISLTIKGLFSYQKEQTIHFDRLIEGQLFGIFGPVGSGKSSILEAIAFALYGETERLHLRDDRNYNMMNLKSDELLIDFEFLNFDDKRYRYTVKGRRSGKKFEKVNTFERHAYQYLEGEWQPMASSMATEILGLSYENFRRTIIIPQGKFQEFLQLTDKARTDMLKDIFQLDKFEFFQQTTSLERKNNEVVQLLKGQLMAYAEVNDERLAASKAQLLKREQLLNELKGKVQKQELLSKEQETLKQLFQELTAIREKHHDLQEQAARYAQAKSHLSDFEYCERHFKADLLRLEELESGILKRKASLDEYEHQLKTCDTQLMKLQQEHANISKQVQQLDNLKNKQQDYQHGITLLALKTTLDKLEVRIEKGKLFVEKAQSDKLNFEKLAARLREELRQKKLAKPDVGQLTAVNVWFKQLEHLRQHLKLKHIERNQLIAEVKAQDEQIFNLQQLADLEEGEQSIKFHLEELNGQYHAIHEQINHYQLQLRLSDFTAALHRGEACPLCGATDHPQILELEDVQDHLKRLQLDLEALQVRQKKYLELDRQLELTVAKRTDLLKRKEQVDKQHADQELLIDEHSQSFKWPTYTQIDAQKVEQQLVNLKLLEEEIEQLERQIVINEEDLKKAEASRNQYEEGLKKIVAEQQVKTGTFQSLADQLKIITIADIGNRLVLRDFEAGIVEIETHINATISRNEQLQQALQNQQQLKITLETRMHAVQDNLKAEADRLLFIQNKLQEELHRSKFNHIDEVKELLAIEINVEDARKEIEQFRQQFYNVKEQLNKLERQTAGKSFDPAQFEQSEKELNALKEALETETAGFLNERNYYERLLMQRDEKVKLSKVLGQAETRAEHISVLKNLFKGNGFVSFVSSVYLQQLCEMANKRFYKLTRQQLKLEVTERNEFQVRDYLNDGKVRLAKTLSGGQTFQASLSLALALAESVQQQHKAKQNFFFLDEGFGSLDKESLSVAFDTLKSLRKENRIVGIISHVEELQQEIDVFLRVQNDALLGTKVTGNWEE